MIRLNPTHPLHLVMGMIIWSLWLVLIYAGLSLGCMAAPDPALLGPWSWLNLGLLVFTLLVVALLLGLAVRCWRYPVREDHPKQGRFTTRVAAATYLAAAVAVLVTVYPILSLPPCL